ncbi:MAG: RHS repeat-associated core domain-containing protein, partial [Bacteroidales bacterium]|nr:RHS repeat-associated core domain-containing protein [Bacteroidales bacterium]
FNGKELQTIGNLGLLDYGARMYDPAIGRWTAQDPLAEEMYSLSSYRFSLNDPINYVDPNGLFESRKDARRYRREHDDVSGRISRNEDGSFSIIDINEGVVYTKTNKTESLVADDEGVERAVLVTPYTNNENPIIQGIYNAQSNFLNHPVTQITSISLFGLTTVGIVNRIYVLDVNRYKTFNDLLFEAKLISKSRSIQYVKKGGYAKALKDFKALNLRNIKEIKSPDYRGYMGIDANGTHIVVRTGSSHGAPTIEIQFKNKVKNNIKIRYIK